MLPLVSIVALEVCISYCFRHMQHQGIDILRLDLGIRNIGLVLALPTTSAHWLMLFTILGCRYINPTYKEVLLYSICKWKLPFQHCHFQVDCHNVMYFCRDISAWCNIVWVCLVHQTLLYLCKTCIHHSHSSGKPHIHHIACASALNVMHCGNKVETL